MLPARRWKRSAASHSSSRTGPEPHEQERQAGYTTMRVSIEDLHRIGVTESAWNLTNNGAITVPVEFALRGQWALPSRLFRFPIEVTTDGHECFTLGLMHAELHSHPFVLELQAKLGQAIPPEGTANRHGWSKRTLGEWWHAVDLMCSRHWKALLETRQFTTRADLLKAVAHALRYGGRKTSGMTPAIARAILAELNAQPPTYRASTLASFYEPSACRSDRKRITWPVNTVAQLPPTQEPWAILIGLEEGWLDFDRSGHLQWSPKGREHYAAQTATTCLEPNGQYTLVF